MRYLLDDSQRVGVRPLYFCYGCADRGVGTPQFLELRELNSPATQAAPPPAGNLPAGWSCDRSTTDVEFWCPLCAQKLAPKGTEQYEEMRSRFGVRDLEDRV